MKTKGVTLILLAWSPEKGPENPKIQTCPKCGGTGKVSGSTCSTCGGSGKIKANQELKIINL